jgi:hypothetical protein
VKDRDALQLAGRLQALGIAIRSAELSQKARATNEFVQRGGNRAMRRARKRAMKKRGR